MISETSKNSQNQALEERLSNMHEQMAGVTSRLDQTERALDLERATREDIIKAEVAKQVAEEKARIRAEIEAEYAEERCRTSGAYPFKGWCDGCCRLCTYPRCFGECAECHS